MRKVVLGLYILVLFLGGIFQQSQAQDKTLEFNLNIGGLTDTRFKIEVFTMGSGLDIHLGEHIMISPELQLWSYLFDFDLLKLNLGATLNYKLKNFFFGGGVILPLFRTEEIHVLEISGPKINMGFRIINGMKLTFYVLTSFEFECFQYGANIGVVF